MMPRRVVKALEKAIEKITGAVRSFLKLDSRLVGVRQRIEPINKTSIGSFANSEERWMEKDPILATSYALITLNLCHDNID